MEKTAKVLGILSALFVLIMFVYNLFTFAKTDDLTHGIWAILLALVMRISVTVNPKEGKRK